MTEGVEYWKKRAEQAEQLSAHRMNTDEEIEARGGRIKELEQKVAEIDAALDNGADQDLWIPGTTRAEVVKKLRANLDELESKVAEQKKTIEALKRALEWIAIEECYVGKEKLAEKARAALKKVGKE